MRIKVNETCSSDEGAQVEFIGPSEHNLFSPQFVDDSREDKTGRPDLKGGEVVMAEAELDEQIEL